MDSDVLVLVSGGLDSAACAHYMLAKTRRLRAAFIDYRQKAADAERHAAGAVCAHLEIPLTEVVAQSSETFGAGELPGRNAFLIFSALLLVRWCSGLIALGIHAGTNYYDCSPAFLELADRLVAESTDGRARVVAPFVYWNKKQILEYAQNAGLPVQLTYSCELGSVPPCGLCLSCADRRALGC
jgi:7-cyano-7-deazaguanine synthase